MRESDTRRRKRRGSRKNNRKAVEHGLCGRIITHEDTSDGRRLEKKKGAKDVPRKQGLSFFRRSLFPMSKEETVRNPASHSVASLTTFRLFVSFAARFSENNHLMLLSLVVDCVCGCVSPFYPMFLWTHLLPSFFSRWFSVTPKSWTNLGSAF